MNSLIKEDEQINKEITQIEENIKKIRKEIDSENMKNSKYESIEIEQLVTFLTNQKNILEEKRIPIKTQDESEELTSLLNEFDSILRKEKEIH